MSDQLLRQMLAAKTARRSELLARLMLVVSPRTPARRLAVRPLCVLLLPTPAPPPAPSLVLGQVNASAARGSGQ